MPTSSESPIDCYLREAQELVVLASGPGVDDELRNLLLLRLISSVERAFRDIIAGCIVVCRCTYQKILSRSVSLAATVYYTRERLPLAIYDHAALSGSGELNKTTLILGFDISKNSEVQVAIGLFERICNLRHAIVHARGQLSPGNLSVLGLDPAGGPKSVAIDAIFFTQIVAAAHSAVRAYNQCIFNSMLERWIMEPVLTGDWAKDGEIFTRLVNLLWSRSDRGAPDYAALYAQVAAEL